MSSVNLIRLGGLAAIIAGVVRGLNSFLPNSTTGVTIELLYLFTDLLILLGMVGLYGFQHRESGAWGLLGFLLAILGIVMIRSGAISGVNLYPAGAFIFTVGLSVFAVGSWIASKLPRWVSVFWVLSTVVGVVGYFVPRVDFILFVCSGVFFGVGFAGAGFRVYSATRMPLRR
jgi:hypothetical protein